MILYYKSKTKIEEKLVETDDILCLNLAIT